MDSFYRQTLCGVVVLHRSMVELEEGNGVQSIIGICAFCYLMKHIQCSGIA